MGSARGKELTKVLYMLASEAHTVKSENIPSLKGGTEGQGEVTGRNTSRNSCGGIGHKVG
jgi:hypothetical protein